MRGTDNLREYLQEAILPNMLHDPNAPPMPPEGHKSHLNKLKVRPESWRRLESMYFLPDECQFSTAVLTWAENQVPREPLEEEDEDPVSGVTLTVPCPNASRYEIPLYKETRPNNIARLFKWIDTYPLATVQRTMHLLHPELKKWQFFLPDDYHSPGDIGIFQHFMWSPSVEETRRLNPAELRAAERKQVVVAFQPPWVLSPQDMKAFVRCRSYPTYRAPGHIYPTDLQSEERLWGKLWDLCVHRNTPWFVLTSYHQWVFGRFSDRWTAAHISDVYEWDASSPTIIECLAFWIANAMNLTNNSPFPQVCESDRSMACQTMSTVYDAMVQGNRAAVALYHL
ncbi:hypothetical protein L218DRAFT_954968 [Marasmius fiardii PR-910]|nr:hypothetical protein L218DRAFT_954968 [Marasmius fiardii PR-910]